MKDLFEREISYLRISVTDLCNLRCRYCMPECGVEKWQHDKTLSFEEIEQIVRCAAELGVKKLRITGGEPLVRRGIAELCRQLKAIDGIEELALTTNGILLADCAQALKQAGVDRVNISLDTLNGEKFGHMTRGGELNRVLAGIAAAKAAGLTPIKLNCVLIGGFNDDEIADFVALTRDEDVEVRFIELMPLGPGAQFPKESFLPCDEVLRRVPELESLHTTSGVARLYRLPDGKGKVGLISPVSCEFCHRCDRLRLTSDGKLKPCLHSDKEIPLRGLENAELLEAITQAIQSKPRRRVELCPGQPTAGGRSMNRIGG